MLFTYLHLAASEELTLALAESGAACVAYETVETDNRALPLLAPMSEIAGRLSAQAVAYFLRSRSAGGGLLLGGVPGVAPWTRAVVIGGSIVGDNAAVVIALGLAWASVTILERSVDRTRHLDESVPSPAASARVDVLDPADRGVDRRGGRRHRRGADSLGGLPRSRGSRARCWGASM